MARFICSDESLNSYGFWVLTSGINIERFLKNPIMLWNHHRSWAGQKNDVLPIGYWKDLRIEKGQLTAESVFDTKDDFAQQIASKVDQQIVRACSIGIRVLATSMEEEHLKPGQTRETITACELREISLCDIPSNGNAIAIALYDENDCLIELSETNSDSLPSLITKLNNDMGKINKTLGLADNAGEDLAVAEITKLNDKIAQLEKEKKDAQDAALKDMVTEAIRQGKTTEDKREMYMNIGRTAGVETLRSVLADLQSPVRPTQLIRPGKTDTGDKKFSEYTSEELESLRENDPERYSELFEAEYGFAPTL